jgi:transcriptional regulator with XRE-family HTH domain
MSLISASPFFQHMPLTTDPAANVTLLVMRQLKMLLRNRGKTQSWLAERLSVHHVTVSNWVRGVQSPNMATIRQIADLLGCEPDEIAGGIPLMTDEERRHLADYRELSPDQRAIVDQMMRALRRKLPSNQENPDLANSAKKSD